MLRRRLCQKSARKMSISLFSAIPAGAIEVLTDAKCSPYFKRADLGPFLGIVDIARTFKNMTKKSCSKIAAKDRALPRAEKI